MGILEVCRGPMFDEALTSDGVQDVCCLTDLDGTSEMSKLVRTGDYLFEAGS